MEGKREGEEKDGKEGREGGRGGGKERKKEREEGAPIEGALIWKLRGVRCELYIREVA